VGGAATADWMQGLTIAGLLMLGKLAVYFGGASELCGGISSGSVSRSVAGGAVGGSGETGWELVR
jgi:hypothetical protein